MRHFYSDKIIATIIIFGLFAGFAPKIMASTIPAADLITSISQPLNNLVDTVNEFLTNFKNRLSQNSFVQKITGYIPQNQGELTSFVDRLSGFFGNFNRWLDSTIGVNINVIGRIVKNLFVWFIQIVTSLVKGGVSLVR